ncbi:MAG: MauE/DoxX family redox-associated membrane protein [Bacteroidota bacterium]
MKRTYHINGMTCNGCRSAVEKGLNELSEVLQATVNLDKAEALVSSEKEVSLEKLQGALGSKYSIAVKKNEVTENGVKEKSKFQQLKPLLLILFYISATALLLHFKNWSLEKFMLDFMGLFYIVFSFFKLLDLKGFPASFRMYDPLAKIIPVYAWIYPFIEIALGLMFLMRYQTQVALLVTVLVLGITTIGVTKTLLDKRSIRCACLGTALKLPMTEATFIENLIMIIMAVWMLLS